MKRIKILVSGLLLSSTMMAAVVQTNGNNVTITPDGGQAKVVYLEVINNQIIRVRATSKDALPVKPASLIRVPVAAPAKGSYTITDEGDNVVVRTQKVKAVVQKATGQITFFDASGKQLLKEAQEGKKFWDFTVPERELGMKTGYTVPEEQKHGLSWQMKFDSPEDEAFYGLGQHQSEEFNMKGMNEDLFQYNTRSAFLSYSLIRTMVCCGILTATVVLVTPTITCNSIVPSNSTIRVVRRVISQAPMSMPVVKSWSATRTLSIMNMVRPRNRSLPSKPIMAASNILLFSRFLLSVKR